MAKKPARIKIGDLRHRIKLCRWDERPDDDVGIVRERPEIAEVWASIQPMKAISVYGWKVNVGALEAPTHKVVMRNPSDVQVTSDMWIYTVTKREQVWFKILQVQPIGDDERYLELSVSKREAKDTRQDPVAVSTPLPAADEVENPFEEPEMDAPTDSQGVGRPDLGRFMR